MDTLESQLQDNYRPRILSKINRVIREPLVPDISLSRLFLTIKFQINKVIKKYKTHFKVKGQRKWLLRIQKWVPKHDACPPMNTKDSKSVVINVKR